MPVCGEQFEKTGVGGNLKNSEKESLRPMSGKKLPEPCRVA